MTITVTSAQIMSALEASNNVYIETMAQLIPATFADLTPKLVTRFAELGLKRIDDDHLAFDPAQLAEVEAIAERIVNEYEDGDDMPTWEQFELSGDDDGDYCGSHILILCEALHTLA